MKVYYIDKLSRNVRLKREIEKNGVENIETKDSYSFRATKNDFIILSEYNPKDSDNTLLSKYNNLIVITNEKDSETISKLANYYKTIDIIYNSDNVEYIGSRIAKLIKI